MPITIRHIKEAYILNVFKEQLKEKPQQFFNVTVTDAKDDDDYEVRDLAEELRGAFAEVNAHQNGKIKLKNAREVLNSLS